MDTIKDENDFIKSITNYLQLNPNRTGTFVYKIGDETKETIFKYQEFLPLSPTILSRLKSIGQSSFDKADQNIIKCTFKKPLEILAQENKIHFIDCIFEEEVISTGYSGTLTFSNCEFKKGYKAEDAIYEGKVRFWQCHFKEDANFRNTKFNELVDFWRATFYKPTIFYKTDFLNTVVFSAANFKENVLFTYARIEKLMLLRGTKAEKGFDLSLAIIPGKLSLFEFNLEDYKNVKYFTDEDEYEKAVSELAIIPVKNKRETFRILKDNLESQKNLSESLKYKAIEKEILRNELKEFKKDLNVKKWQQFKNWINNRFERINLLLNKWSNDHGNSYGRAFAFIIIVGWIFFYISLLTTQTYSFIGLGRICEWDFTEGFKLFIQFLNPIHKLDYIENEKTLSLGFYIFDFLGKTFVGYGIYQFIQAFRKYK